MKKAVILVSGGLDSAVTLAYAKSQGYSCYVLTADYGQRHRIEIEQARQIAKTMAVTEHKVIAVDLRAIGGSALTDSIAVPESRQPAGVEIPITYVPARNTILLSLALAWAEVLRADAIFIGVNAVDYSGYPDCRPEYLQIFEQLARMATKAGVSEDWRVRIEAPLINLSKAEIIKLGKKLRVDFSITTYCYNPGPHGQPCGICESCLLRQKGFAEAGEQDPRLIPFGDVEILTERSEV
jgi:7-cyano-7-deazaguanine synthase